MIRIVKVLCHALAVMLLTLFTQIGGVVYIVALFVSNKVKIEMKGKEGGIFLGIYLITTFLFIPPLARLGGREPIQHSDKIHPTSYFTVIFNRNYVKPQLNQLLKAVELQLESTDIQIHYLDANFPFIDGFPLPPHLSHNDGKKLDLSFIYKEDSKLSSKAISPTGYGVFEEPRADEHNQIAICENGGFIQYSMAKIFTFGMANHNLKFAEYETQFLINTILKQAALGKVFIEPHLKARMELNHKKVRYHGCHAVRHDDHIHIQLK